MHIKSSLVLNWILVITMFYQAQAQTGPQHNKAVVCYISTWAVYRPDRGSYSIDNFDPNLCTIAIYAFAGLDIANDAIKSLVKYPNYCKNAISQDRFTLSIIHINDFHARFVETNRQSNDCKPDEECIGGYARVVTKVKELLASRENPIYLNAGDNFQGTLWYNIGRWNVTNQFLNMLPADVQTIGNHDFDHDIDGIVPFLERTATPVVIANIDDSEEPTFQNKTKKSVVLIKSGRKIGVIGAILRTTNTIAKTGKLKFFNEAEKVKEEAQRLKDEEGVDIIVVVSHCGIERDMEIAKYGGPNIDIIVGGHSHSFLWSGVDLPPLDKPAYSYPVIVNQTDGHRVLIVQASAYTKYVGDIRLHFDDNGIIQEFDGNPHFLGTDVEQNAEVLEALEPWKEKVNREGQRVVGSIHFRAAGSGCYLGACLMGSLQADAMAYAAFEEDKEEGAWTFATIAITNPGGVRGSLEPGLLTYSNLVTTTPFENTIDKLEIQGKYLREAFEFSARYDSPSILQTSGVRVVYNMTKAAYSRVHSLQVLCRICEVPRYEDIQDDTWYRVMLNNFILQNGDNFAMLRDNMRNHQVGPVDIDALTKYVEAQSPITMLPPHGRVSFI
ncbi:unnamed protein product [Chironomus riparius]|uniref:apyrase n=1 Tax=Chironomus riparius TaxID=315576 RepID=A0A9N9WLY0_9DIPT|nr:unnamed protein product [Chironomus riparius]